MIIFDLDGTLIDPWAGVSRCLSEALTAIGAVMPPEEELKRWIVGPPMEESIARILAEQNLASQLAAATAGYRHAYDESGFREFTVYPNIPLVLNELRQQGLELAIATSKPEPAPRLILESLNLADGFSVIVGADLISGRRQKLQVLKETLARRAIHPPAHPSATSRVVMIGDRYHDVEAATALGLPTIGVLWGYGSRTELAQAGAKALAESPEDLLTLIPPFLL